MRYKHPFGGKRVRPVLVYATGETRRTAGATGCAAAAVELFMSTALRHDDLPAMMTMIAPGRATCHRAFDEATAILTGDAPQARAFEVPPARVHFRGRARKLRVLLTVLAQCRRTGHRPGW